MEGVKKKNSNLHHEPTNQFKDRPTKKKIAFDTFINLKKIKGSVCIHKLYIKNKLRGISAMTVQKRGYKIRR